MAPPRKPPPAAAPAPAPAAPDDDVMAPEDSLSGLLAEIGGGEDASITVYRCGPNQQQTYVFKTTPGAFSLDDLRDKYNGGQFRLYIARNGQLWKNRVVSVEPKQVTGVSEPAPSALSELAAVMREGFVAQANAMRELAQRQAAAPPPPPFAGMDLPAIITAISGAVVALKPPAPPPVPAESASRAIEMFMKGIDMARELRGEGGGGEGGLMGLVQTAMKSPILAAAVQGAMQQQQALQRQALPPPPPPPSPVSPPAPPASFASETSDPKPPQDASMIAFYLKLLCNKAAAQSDPILYAEMVLDNLDDDQLTALLDMKPTPIDALAQIVPDVAQHREWFDQLLTAVRDALASHGEGDGQSGQVNGAANAPSSAAPDVLGGTAQG